MTTKIGNMTTKKWTRDELKAIGVPNELILDRSTHPMGALSSWDVSASDRQVSGQKARYHLPHIRPQSVLIASIGNLWEEGAWWRLQDMMLATAVEGHSVSIQEMADSSLFSFEAIPMMRWSASMMARDSGVEWCFMVDNDALVQKDTLLRLLSHDRPVVFPLLEDLEKRMPRIIAPMSDPDLIESGHGLIPVRWAAMSCMLLNTKIFNVLEPTAWRGNDFVFSQALNHLGHRVYVDTDTVVQVTKGPARHASKGYDEFWADHRKMWDRLRTEERDHRPPPGFNPLKDDGWVDKSGSYFGVLNKVARGGEHVEPRDNGAKEKESKLWRPS